jgi:ferrous iron transport protein B
MGIKEDNWPATVGIFTGILAKEAVVGSISTLYGQAESASDVEFSLQQDLRDSVATIPSNLAAIVGIGTAGDQAGTGTGTEATIFARLRTQFSPAAAYAYLLFVLLYFPCAASLAAAMKEMGTALGWVLAAYTTILAWGIATLFYQFASGPQVGPVLIALGLVAGLIVALWMLGRSSFARRYVEPRI